MKTITTIVLTALCLAAINVSAKDLPPNPYREILSHVAAAELPAKAADAVKQSKTRDRELTTTKVVTAALEINPAAASAIVGAIARAVPDMASVAAGTAAEMQPQQTLAIARAAASVAPDKAGKIVESICRVVPNAYRDVAMLVSQIVPGVEKEILQSVGTAIPSLKPAIMQILATSKGKVTSLTEPLNQLANAPTVVPAAPIASSSAPVTSTAMARSVRGPAVGPPYIPLSGTPGNVNPGNTGEVPPGGRNYAAP